MKPIAAIAAAAVLGLGGAAAQAQLIQHNPLDGNGDATVGTSGTLVGSAAPAPDQNGTADGAVGFASTSASTGGYVDIPGGGGLNNLQSGTIAFWAQWNGTQDAACCGGTFGNVTARQGNGLFSNQIIGLNNADPDQARVAVQLYSAGPPTLVGNTVVGNGDWHHVALTYTSGQQQLYIDGDLNATSFATGTITNNGGIPLTIGAWTGDGAGYSTSTINDFRVYDAVLSESQIEALIPEPASLGLIGLAGVGLLARRRRG